MRQTVEEYRPPGTPRRSMRGIVISSGFVFEGGKRPQWLLEVRWENGLTNFYRPEELVLI